MRIRDSIDVEEKIDKGSHGFLDTTYKNYKGRMRGKSCIEVERNIQQIVGGFSGGGNNVSTKSRYFIWVRNDIGFITRVHERDFKPMGMADEFSMSRAMSNGMTWTFPFKIDKEYAERCIEIISYCLSMEEDGESKKYFMDRIDMLTGNKYEYEMRLDPRHKQKTFEQLYMNDVFFTREQEQNYYESERLKREKKKDWATRPQNRPEKTRNRFSSILK